MLNNSNATRPSYSSLDMDRVITLRYELLNPCLMAPPTGSCAGYSAEYAGHLLSPPYPIPSESLPIDQELLRLNTLEFGRALSTVLPASTARRIYYEGVIPSRSQAEVYSYFGLVLSSRPNRS